MNDSTRRAALQLGRAAGRHLPDHQNCIYTCRAAVVSSIYMPYIWQAIKTFYAAREMVEERHHCSDMGQTVTVVYQPCRTIYIT